MQQPEPLPGPQCGITALRLLERRRIELNDCRQRRAAAVEGTDSTE